MPATILQSNNEPLNTVEVEGITVDIVEGSPIKIKYVLESD